MEIQVLIRLRVLSVVLYELIWPLTRLRKTIGRRVFYENTYNHIGLNFLRTMGYLVSRYSDKNNYRSSVFLLKTENLVSFSVVAVHPCSTITCTFVLNVHIPV